MLGALQQDLAGGFSGGYGVDPSMTGAIATELRKALDAGYAIVNQSGGAALRAQSLEGSLKVQTWTQKHLVLTKMLQRTPAFSTVEEWAEALSWGTRTGGYVLENDLPASSTAELVRKTLFIKYAATVRGLSHVMASVHPAFGDNIALENRAGVLYLLERVEQTVQHGDSSLHPSGQGVEPDGLANLIDSSTILDCQNQTLSQPLIDAMAALLFQNKAYPDSLILGINTRRDLISSYLPYGRFNMPMSAEGKLGAHLKQIDTGVGDIDLYPSIFVEEAPSPSAAATHANAPNPFASVTPSIGSLATADFNKAAPSGDDNYYGYAVAAGNRFGESAPRFVGATQQMTGANKTAKHDIALAVVNAAAPGTYPPDYVAVYRTKVQAASTLSTDPADYSLVFKAAVSSAAGGATTTLHDLNTYLPFTSKAYMGQWDEEVITLRELLPMFRLDLGVQALAYRWIVAWYHALALFASRKFGMFINIGKSNIIPVSA